MQLSEFDAAVALTKNQLLSDGFVSEIRDPAQALQGEIKGGNCLAYAAIVAAVVDITTDAETSLWHHPQQAKHDRRHFGVFAVGAEDIGIAHDAMFGTEKSFATRTRQVLTQPNSILAPHQWLASTERVVHRDIITGWRDIDVVAGPPEDILNNTSGISLPYQDLVALVQDQLDPSQLVTT